MQAYYLKPALERAMKVQEVILRAISGQILWYEASEILGISDRQMRRWKTRYEKYGYDGLYDRRKKMPSPKWTWGRCYLRCIILNKSKTNSYNSLCHYRRG